MQSTLHSLLQDLPSVPAIDLAVASFSSVEFSWENTSPFAKEILTSLAACAKLREIKKDVEASSVADGIWLKLNSSSVSTETSIEDIQTMLAILCLIELGKIAKELKDFDRAFGSFQQALELALALKSKSFDSEDIDVMLCTIHYQLGLCSEAINKVANSISSYSMHLSLISKMRPSKIDWKEFSDSCLRISLTLKNGASLRLAEEYVSRATAAATKANDSVLLSKCTSIMRYNHVV